MKPIFFNGLLIHLHPKAEPANVWWLSASIEDPADGQFYPVVLPEHYPTRKEALVESLREARRRILNSCWCS